MSPFFNDPRIAAGQAGVCFHCGLPAQQLGFTNVPVNYPGIGGINNPYISGVAGLGQVAGINNPYLNISPWTLAEINALQAISQLQNSGMLRSPFGLGAVQAGNGIFSRI